MQDETGPSFDMERGADDKENAKLTHGCCPIFHVQDDDYFRPVDGPMHMLYPAVPLQQGQGSQGERSIAKSQRIEIIEHEISPGTPLSPRFRRFFFSYLE